MIGCLNSCAFNGVSWHERPLRVCGLALGHCLLMLLSVLSKVHKTWAAALMRMALCRGLSAQALGGLVVMLPVLVILFLLAASRVLALRAGVLLDQGVQ